MHESHYRYTSEYLRSIPEATDYQERLSQRLEREKQALQIHLTDPSTTAAELSATTGLTIDEIRELYAEMQTDQDVRAITNSLYYPRRMMTQFAKATIQDWLNDPEYANKLLQGDTVAARNLEVHATKGTCDYTCTMCLWSDKEALTYRNLGLNELGLMDVTDWERVFKSAHELGTQRIVFSGGGEPMLNKNLFGLSATARAIGLKTQLYSNGYGLRRASQEDWDEIMHMEQVRFSMHSPTSDIYDQIVNMPDRSRALPTVTANIQELLARRAAFGGNVRVGIGFVTQALNHHQIEDMVNFAQTLGVDFINLRQDEVEVTRNLGENERKIIATQLLSVRNRIISGEFGAMLVDMSDDMTAMVNGVEQTIRQTKECFAKLFRPAISPFGVVAPCDLRAEPRFSDPNYALGNTKRESLPLIIGKATKKTVDASCAQCMPSGKTINSIVTKLIQDTQIGIHYTEQPFARL